MKKPMVGQNIDGWCTRCKMVLAHTIESMIGSKITRVHCNTCGAQHVHRAQPPGERATASGGTRTRARAGTSKARTPAPRSTDYATLVGGRDAATARPYRPSERFAATDLIAHPTFGLGVVTATKDSTKIEVVFADGPKILVHCR